MSGHARRRTLVLLLGLALGSSCQSDAERARLGQVADVIEYEVDEDGSYHWTMWEWTGGGLTPEQTSAG